MSKYFNEEKISPEAQTPVDAPTSEDTPSPIEPYYDDDIEEREDTHTLRQGTDSRNINEPEVGAALNWIEKGLLIIKKYKFAEILKAFILLLTGAFVVYVCANPARFFDPLIKTIIERYEATKNDDHYNLIERRVATSPIIQARCNELLYKVGASRVLFFELHNNTNNIGGLPFFFASSSCEALDDNTFPVADQYRDVKLSLFPFVTDLFSKRFWGGDVEDLKGIDKSLYYKLKSNDAEQVAGIIVDGPDKPYGILIVTFTEGKNIPDMASLRGEMAKTGTKLAILISTNKQ